MTTTIKNLIANHEIIASGFPAIADLSNYGTKGTPVYLTSLAPTILLEQGINEYYALELPRNTIFNSAEEIIAADLPVRQYCVSKVDNVAELDAVIVSRHQGTVNILKEQYPDAPVLESIMPADIEGKHVVGTLPPHLISSAEAYTPVTIKGFNYAVDGDLSGQELLDRMVISNKAIKLVEVK
ncbi:hypothetical protein JOD82_002304 [Paenibacillus sp. 1182]|uniref:CRISPR-associated protein Csx16 n=1 Tax=Paenibacillus sp. 1182 TaxID=2806565 RepID=UPI001AE9117D|nr:CRISPR-associated protein Csx16 [Paenibacillus sp. 1182]MBP1309284.1 hypothetical protein [Paenibacillus sp. 1182]